MHNYEPRDGEVDIPYQAGMLMATSLMRNKDQIEIMMMFTSVFCKVCD